MFRNLFRKQIPLPPQCPRCGSDKIGRIDDRASHDPPDYPARKPYCISCGWVHGSPEKVKK